MTLTLFAVRTASHLRDQDSSFVQHLEGRHLADLLNLLNAKRGRQVEALLDSREPSDAVVEGDSDMNATPVDEDVFRPLGDLRWALAVVPGSKLFGLLGQSGDVDLGEQSVPLQ